MEKTTQAVNSTFFPDGNVDHGESRGRSSTRLRDHPKLCFACSPNANPSSGLSCVGREEGLENSSDITQTSAWNQNTII